MNKTQHMLTILEARAKGRAIESRKRCDEPDTTREWIPLTAGDGFINFIQYEFRIAPVSQELWLLYNATAKFYCDVQFKDGSGAAAHAIAMQKNYPDVEYVPVCMVPKRAP